MKWQKASDYAIHSGQFTISRSIVNGVDIFTLWKGVQRVGNYVTAEKAKEAAK